MRWENTHFEKVQAFDYIVNFEHWYPDCGDNPCQNIVMNNCSVKHLNYGYNYTNTSGLDLKGFLDFNSFLDLNSELLTIEITNSHFEHNFIYIQTISGKEDANYLIKLSGPD